MAGAERPEKAGGERVSGTEIFAKIMAGKPLGVGDQGMIINFELTGFAMEVITATEHYKKGRKYQTIKSLASPVHLYLGYLINGVALMNMIICLSQAPQNGWETWFSLNYGTDLSKLAIAIPTIKSKSYKSVLAEAKRSLQSAQTKADPKKPVTKNTHVFQNMLVAAKTDLLILESIQN